MSAVVHPPSTLAPLPATLAPAAEAPAATLRPADDLALAPIDGLVTVDAALRRAARVLRLRWSIAPEAIPALEPPPGADTLELIVAIPRGTATRTTAILPVSEDHTTARSTSLPRGTAILPVSATPPSARGTAIPPAPHLPLACAARLTNSAGETLLDLARVRPPRPPAHDTDPATAQARATTSAPGPLWQSDEERGLEHVDIPPLLRATFRPGRAPGQVEVLYARTSLLTLLGLPGGRYEPAGGELAP